MQGFLLGKQALVQSPVADGAVKQAAQGQHNDPFPQCYVQGIEPESTANINGQLPADQKGIPNTWHQQAENR